MSAACCRRCSRWSFQDDDSPEERRRKEISIPVTMCGLLGSLWGLYKRTDRGFGQGDFDAYTCAQWTSVINNAMFLGYIVCTRRLPRWAIEAVMLLGSVAVLLLDWAAATTVRPTRAWPVQVLTLDLLLLLDARPAVGLVVAGCTVLWLLIASVEDSIAFGLFDMSGFAERNDKSDVCACATPPCVSGNAGGAIGFAMVPVLVFCLDFSITRGFRRAVRQQMSIISASVTLSEEISVLLSQYEVAEAERCIDSAEGTLPAAQHAALRVLCGNLNSYRPFLPMSCLPSEQRGSDDRNDSGDMSGGNSPHISSSHSSQTVSPTVNGGRQMPKLAVSSPLVHRRASAASPRVRSSTSSGADCKSPRSRRPTFSNTRRSRMLNDNTRGRGASMRRGSSVTSLGRSAHSPVSRRRGGSGSSGTPRSPLSPAGVKSPVAAAANQPRPSSRGAVSVEARRRTVTLLCTNRGGFLKAVQGVTPGEVAAWFRVDVAFAHSVAMQSRGVIDLLSADHQYLSFGAARPCASHRLAAVGAAGRLTCADPGRAAAQEMACARLGALPMNAAACSGEVLSGDFGSMEQKRFMALGGAASLCGVMERVGARWSVSSLINAAVQADVETRWYCRALDQVQYHKAGTKRPVMLWEAVEEVPDDPVDQSVVNRSQTDTEWMYQLEAGMEANPFNAFNEAVQLWAKGNKLDAMRKVGVAEGSGDRRVRSAASLLAARIRRSAAMPVLQLRDAGVEDAAPAHPPGDAPRAPPSRVDSESAIKEASALSSMMADHIRREETIAQTRAEERQRQQMTISNRVSNKRQALWEGTRARAPSIGLNCPLPSPRGRVHQADISMDVTNSGCGVMLPPGAPQLASPRELLSPARRGSAMNEHRGRFSADASHRTGIASIASGGDGLSGFIPVTLVRPPGDVGAWGIFMHDVTMELLSLTDGSPAAQSAALRSCVGLRLAFVNGIASDKPHDMVEQMQACSCLELLFDPDPLDPDTQREDLTVRLRRVNENAEGWGLRYYDSAEATPAGNTIVRMQMPVPGSVAAESGRESERLAALVKAGAELVAVNGVAVRTKEEAQRLEQRHGATVHLHFTRAPDDSGEDSKDSTESKDSSGDSPGAGTPQERKTLPEGRFLRSF